MMHKPGEDRSSVSDVFGNVHDHCIELMAGRAAGRMLLEIEPVTPVDDLRQARELAMLICSSEEAIETFIAHYDVAARDLLLPYGDVVIPCSLPRRVEILSVAVAAFRTRSRGMLSRSRLLDFVLERQARGKIRDVGKRRVHDLFQRFARSLRPGFLTSAAAKGASIFKMMDQSGHKSIDTLRGYVRDAELFKDHAGAGLL